MLGNGKRESLNTHRLSYLVFKGEIPEGFLVCHTCDIRNCINPSHLFLGTHQDNMSDMSAKNRAVVNLESLKGNNRAGKKILAENIEYDSYAAAARALGITANSVKKRLVNNWPGYKKLH